LRDRIQGGIEYSYGDPHPYIYLETGHAGLQTKLLRTATTFGQMSTIRLVEHRPLLAGCHQRAS